MDNISSHPFIGYLATYGGASDEPTYATQRKEFTTEDQPHKSSRVEKPKEFQVLPEEVRKKIRREISSLEQLLEMEKKHQVTPNLETEKKLLRAKLTDVESAYQATKNLLQETQALFNNAKVKLQSKDEKIAKLEQELAVVNQKKRKKEEEYEQLQCDYQNQARELANVHSLSERRLEDNTHLTYELHIKGKEVEAQKKEIESLQKTLQEEQATKEQVRAKYVESWQQLQQKEEKYQQLLKEVANQKLLLQNAQSKNQDAQTEIDSLNAKITLLEKEIREKQVTIAELSNKLASQKDCIKKIQNSVQALFSVTSHL
jgi:chromosome segregation ATPase